MEELTLEDLTSLQDTSPNTFTLLSETSYKDFETTNRNQSLENKKPKQDLCGRFGPRPEDKPAESGKANMSSHSG